MSIMQAPISLFTQKVSHSVQRHTSYHVVTGLMLLAFVFFMAMQNLAFASSPDFSAALEKIVSKYQT